ncbi:hypothetical protein SLA2020_398640 [Shorea laevis]
MFETLSTEKLIVGCKIGPITAPGFNTTQSIPFSVANLQAASSAYVLERLYQNLDISQKSASENHVSSTTTSGINGFPLYATAATEDFTTIPLIELLHMILEH